MRRWVMTSWVDGTEARGVRGVSVAPSDGLHGPLIEAWGAFAYPLDVPGDPRRWVCHWTSQPLGDVG